MDKLIQTEEASIIYGKWKGEDNQELFRCPRLCDDTDLPRYVNQYRKLVQRFDEIPFVDDDTKDLWDVEGKELIGYFRMYYSYGWAGKWFLEDGEPDKLDCYGVQQIIDWIVDTFEKGCNFYMQGFMKDNFKPWGSENRYLLRPFLSDYYKVMIDTTYGNGDYPVRIYAYRDKEAMI